jgi:hypothetical protein
VALLKRVAAYLKGELVSFVNCHFKIYVENNVMSKSINLEIYYPRTVNYIFLIKR